MKNTNLNLLLCTSFLALCSPIAAKAQAVSFIDAISNGQTHFDARLRYEYVEQLGIMNDANATTLRTKINYQTKRFNGISALIEFENITNLFGSNFNDTINGKTTYPIVAD